MVSPTLLRLLALALIALWVTSCAVTTSTRVSTRALPPFEPPMGQASFQTVRTTAYTHTEADHLAYGARNAMGGRLQPASRPIQRAELNPWFAPDLAYTFAKLDPLKKKWSGKKSAAKRKTTTRRTRSSPPRIGSAAADWSRWPAGTTFRILSTGQTYRVDDYGWALSGRNTIDLYMGSQRDMNKWGVRTEKIQILKWGDRETSRRILADRQAHKHCRRMLLQLQGDYTAAATLN